MSGSSSGLNSSTSACTRRMCCYQWMEFFTHETITSEANFDACIRLRFGTEIILYSAFIYCCPEHRSCHEMSRWLQASYAAKLSCAMRRYEKYNFYGLWKNRLLCDKSEIAAVSEYCYVGRPYLSGLMLSAFRRNRLSSSPFSVTSSTRRRRQHVHLKCLYLSTKLHDGFHRHLYFPQLTF